MKHARSSLLGGAGVLAALASLAWACGDDRGTFTSGGTFDVDAAAEAGACPYQCSLDGRSVIRSCTGEIVTECPPELACGEATCQEPCAAATAERSSNGCEFRFQAPLFQVSPVTPQSCYAAFVVNTSNKPVELALEFDGKPLDLSKSVFRTRPGEATLEHQDGPLAPGTSAIVFLSDRDPNRERTVAEKVYYKSCPIGVVPALATDLSAGTGVHPSFHLTASSPVGLTSMYPFGGSSTYVPTASLVLPVPTWGTQHIIVDGWGYGYLQPGTQLYAAEDGTELTIVPSRDIQSGGGGVVGAVAGAKAVYQLGKGQYLQLLQDEELSGSIVTSNKPTTVVGGHSCGSVPFEAACDILGQQIPAYEQWGSQYVGVGYRPRLGNEHEVMFYRVVAARNGTRLDYDPAVPPGAPVTLSAGEVVTFESGTGDAFVVRSQDAEHPIYLAAYMTGAQEHGRRGDPEFVNVVPTGQYLGAYSFYADPTYAETSLVIVRAATRGAFNDVWLECAGNLTGFRPIGTRGEYEFVRVDLSRDDGAGETFGGSTCNRGLHRMKSDGPFTATVWGWDVNASYAYPGGMALRKLVTAPLAGVN